MTTARACGKIILFGEHAVVYGQPGIAVPVPRLGNTVSIDDSSFFSLRQDKELEAEQYTKLDSLMQFLFEQLPLKRTVGVTITSSLPLRAGLGSSASLSVALLRAFSQHSGVDMSVEELNRLAFICERIFHGNPSGIDNAVIVYEKPVFYHEKKIEVITSPQPFYVLIADSGVASATQDVVTSVRHRYNEDRETCEHLFVSIGETVRKAKAAFEQHKVSELGALLNENHALLQQLGVSSSRLNHLVNTALQAGAHGAKLSGAGKGGMVVALVEEDTKETVRAALRTVSPRVFSTTIG